MAYSVYPHIGGKIHPIHKERFHTLYNPALGEAIGKVPFADEEVCQLAIKTAKDAWPLWAETSLVKRAGIFFKFRELLLKNQQELMQIVTREHGKTLDDAKGSIARAVELVEFYCGLLTQFQGDYTPEVSANIDCYTLRQPLGVCAGISPFNFPVMVPVWMMIPAIACGNTFILKPSEQDPSASVKLLELLHEAGLPAGVANCIHGDKQTVDFLLTHPDIRTVTAVASSPVAENIYKTAIAHGKRAHTFGGAKNHCVVMPDADFDQAAEAITGAAFGSAGERCMAISAVVAVGNETAEQLLQALLPRIKAIRIDKGDVEGADMGPVISETHRQHILQAVDQGEAEGARLLIDGRTFRHALYPQGYFIGPCLFDEVTESMSIYQNEIFGPVLVLLRAANFDEALSLVNRHQYGNGSAIFTRDGYIARQYSHLVQTGMVGINIPIPVPVASHPFGGCKRSVFGDTLMHGKESIHFYTQLKTITSRWPVTKINNAFIMPTHD